MLLMFEKAVVPSISTWTVNAKDEGSMIPQSIMELLTQWHSVKFQNTGILKMEQLKHHNKNFSFRTHV